jgi:(R,R)-butanediol dehydrogenase/meso-butanediol dehydrogenase/diacetyl reductase
MTAVYYRGGGSFAVGACETGAPADDEVTVEVAYCGICGTDLHIAQGHMDGRVRAPQVIGHEAAGRIAAVGADVDSLAVGEAVVVRPLDTRGETPADKGFAHVARHLRFLGIDSPGALQTRWNVPAFTVHRVPPGTDLRLAALVEPLAVACHDVARSGLRPGETALVIGGGPIGVLIALVARSRGGRVVVSELSDRRLRLCRELGLETVDPRDGDVAAVIKQLTDGRLADVVFEVSGSAAGLALTTKTAGIRSRIVVVAIFPEPQPVSLFDLFWKELELYGARVYEPSDFERAIALVHARALPLDRLVTSVEPLQALPELFPALVRGGEEMKVLVDCGS